MAFKSELRRPAAEVGIGEFLALVRDPAAYQARLDALTAAEKALDERIALAGAADEVVALRARLADDAAAAAAARAAAELLGDENTTRAAELDQREATLAEREQGIGEREAAAQRASDEAAAVRTSFQSKLDAMNRL